MKIKYLIFLILIIAAGLNLISCQPEEPKPIAPTNIIVNSAAKPEETFISKQEIPLPNCAGSAELSMSLGSVTTIQKGVTIGTKATAGAKTGIDIPAAASAELAASVEGSYQQAYQTTVTHLSTMIMSAAPHTSIIYVIEWDNQDYASTVDFDDKNDVGMHYKTDYHYTLTVPKFSDSLSQPCPNGPTPTNVTSVQAPEEFIRHYFSLVTYYRDYHLAWSLLTTAFQEKNDPGGLRGVLEFRRSGGCGQS